MTRGNDTEGKPGKKVCAKKPLLRFYGEETWGFADVCFSSFPCHLRFVYVQIRVYYLVGKSFVAENTQWQPVLREQREVIGPGPAAPGLRSSSPPLGEGLLFQGVLTGEWKKTLPVWTPNH